MSDLIKTPFKLLTPFGQLPSSGGSGPPATITVGVDTYVYTNFAVETNDPDNVYWDIRAAGNDPPATSSITPYALLPIGATSTLAGLSSPVYIYAKQGLDLTYMRFGSSSGHYTFDIGTAPSTISTYDLRGDCACTGLLSSFKGNALAIYGDNAALEGNLRQFPVGKTMSIWGGCPDITGDLYDYAVRAPLLGQSIKFGGLCNIDTYSGSADWTGISQFIFDSTGRDAGLSTAETDQLLIDLDAALTSDGFSFYQVTITAGDQVRSKSSDTAVASLLAKNYLVNLNS